MSPGSGKRVPRLLAARAGSRERTAVMPPLACCLPAPLTMRPPPCMLRCGRRWRPAPRAPARAMRCGGMLTSCSAVAAAATRACVWAPPALLCSCAVLRARRSRRACWRRCAATSRVQARRRCRAAPPAVAGAAARWRGRPWRCTPCACAAAPAAVPAAHAQPRARLLAAGGARREAALRGPRGLH